MLNKLKRKFIIVNIVCVTVILIMVYITICLAAFRTEYANITRELRGASEKVIFGDRLPSKPDLPDKNDIFENAESPISTVTVFLDKDGNIEKTYADTTPSEATPLLEDIVKLIKETDKESGILRNHSLIYVKSDFNRKASVTMTSTDILEDRLSTVTRISGLVLLSCLFLFFILSYFLASIAIKPAKQTWEAQKQFIADASHDMKTPLTVILANTEIIKSHQNDSVESVDKWLSSTKEEAERMRRLVDSMLELSSTETVGDGIELTDVDLSEITERTVLQMEPIAFEKTTVIESNIEQNLKIKGNADALSRLLHILIDNGIKYTKSGAQLTITLERVKRDARLSVINEGSYIDEDDIPHLFERFYRGDKARSSDGGFGLGLSIAKNLTNSMGGEISAENKNGIGAVFSVSFPISEKLLPKFFPQKL